MYTKDPPLGKCNIEILKPCSGEDLLKNDRISDLSDDILITILSSLTLKEVGRTSVLSKRWRNVWTYVPSLNFDRGDMFFEKFYSITKEERKEEELKYFRWVEQVVNSHEAHNIDEFMIRYDLQDSRNDNIDNWITFAVEKRVKRLQLNIKPVWATKRVLPYTLPKLSFVNSLISLELCGVEVSGEVLEKILCDCQTLESLSVTNSRTLVYMKVGPSLRLKSLKFCDAFEMKHLEIYAPNLISFEYAGEKISWPLMISTPKLVQLSIGRDYGSHVKNDFSGLVGILSQIEVFKLSSCGGGDKILARVFPVFPVFRKLKILDMTLDPRFDVELFRLGSFLKACPLLHKFALEFTSPNVVEMTKRTRNFKAFRHPHLKILEIRRFMGREVDIAFILYITKGAALLEKLIVAPSSFLQPIVESNLRAKKEAEQLRTIIKPGVELEICESLLYL